MDIYKVVYSPYTEHENYIATTKHWLDKVIVKSAELFLPTNKIKNWKNYLTKKKQ